MTVPSSLSRFVHHATDVDDATRERAREIDLDTSFLIPQAPRRLQGPNDADAAFVS